MKTKGMPNCLCTSEEPVMLSANRLLVDRLRKQGVTATIDYSETPEAGEKPFGTLLALDLYSCREKPLGDVQAGYHFLARLAGNLGMHVQSPPFIFLSDAKKYPDKAGLSGWVPLIESGISLHTIIPARFTTIDVYSCSRIPALETIRFSFDVFRPEHIEATRICRGRNYGAWQRP